MGSPFQYMLRYRLRRWQAGVHGGGHPGIIVLLLVGAWLAWRLLTSIWVIFQHAFTSSYLFIPGGQINSAYWSSIHFAMWGTVAVTAVVTILVVLVVVEVLRLTSGRRRGMW